VKIRGRLKIIGLLLVIVIYIARWFYLGNAYAALGLILACSIVGAILAVNKRVQVISINDDSIDMTQFFIGTFTVWAEEISLVEKKYRNDGMFYEVRVRKKAYRLDDVNDIEFEQFLSRNNLPIKTKTL
jgi:hypothetical protein